MRKILHYCLIAAVCFVFAACNSSSSDNPVVPVVAPDAFKMQGNYELEHMEIVLTPTDGSAPVYMTNNCDESRHSGTLACNISNVVSVLSSHVGVFNDNGSARIVFKTQLAGQSADRVPSKKFYFMDFAKIDNKTAIGTEVKEFRLTSDFVLEKESTLVKNARYSATYDAASNTVKFNAVMPARMMTIDGKDVNVAETIRFTARRSAVDPTYPPEKVVETIIGDKAAILKSSAGSYNIASYTMIARDAMTNREKVISTDCDEAFRYGASACRFENLAMTVDGAVYLAYDETSTSAKITTLIQREGLMFSGKESEKYQYFDEFGSISATSFSAEGVKEYSLDPVSYEPNPTPTEFPKAKYTASFSKDDMTIILTIPSKKTVIGAGEVNAEVTYIIKGKSKTTTNAVKPEHKKIEQLNLTPAEFFAENPGKYILNSATVSVQDPEDVSKQIFITSTCADAKMFGYKGCSSYYNAPGIRTNRKEFFITGDANKVQMTGKFQFTEGRQVRQLKSEQYKYMDFIDFTPAFSGTGVSAASLDMITYAAGSLVSYPKASYRLFFVRKADDGDAGRKLYIQVTVPDVKVRVNDKDVTTTVTTTYSVTKTNGAYAKPKNELYEPIYSNNQLVFRDMEGTYNAITYLGIQYEGAGLPVQYMTNSCEYARREGVSSCSPEMNEVNVKGAGLASKFDDASNLSTNTINFQINGAVADKMLFEKYQYIELPVFDGASLTAKGIKLYPIGSDYQPVTVPERYDDAVVTADYNKDAKEATFTIVIPAKRVKVGNEEKTVKATITMKITGYSSSYKALENKLYAPIHDNFYLEDFDLSSGTYVMTFYGSSESAAYVTNDCAEAIKMGLTTAANCTAASNQSPMINGRVTLELKDRKAYVKAKTQLEERGSTVTYPGEQYRYIETDGMATFASKGVKTSKFDFTNKIPTALSTDAERQYAVELGKDNITLRVKKMAHEDPKMSDMIVIKARKMKKAIEKNDNVLFKSFNVADYAGMYDVVFFGSSQENVRGDDDWADTAMAVYMTNDCETAMGHGWAYPKDDKKNQCGIENQLTMFGGEVAVDGTAAGGKIFTKMQLGSFLMDFAAVSDKYQFTKYNVYDGTLKGTGVSGYNYDATNKVPSLIPTEHPLSTYEMTLEGDTLTIKLLLRDKAVSILGFINLTVDARTTVIAKKRVGEPFVEPTNTLFIPFP